MMVLQARLAGVAVLGLSVVPACAGEPPPAEQPSPSPTEVTIPDTPVGEQVEWVLDQLAADQGPDPDEAEARFADSFLAEVGPEQVAEVFDQLRGLGPWRATGVTGDTHTAEVTLRNGADEPWVMTIAIDPDQRIHTLLFQPDPVADRTPAESWPALTEELSGLAERAGFLAARIEDGQCTPVSEHEPDASLPMGSVFKLYVLGALASAVNDGTLAWEQTVTVTDELRSLPSGRLQDVPEGTEVPLREAADGMIAISDNTATDLIIDRVGREAVAAATAAMGHAEPERNQPFLTTRELFQLGWGDADRRQRWAEADRAERETLLKELASVPLEVTPQDVTTPVWQHDLDWFGSARDLCAAHLALQAQAADEPAVREILSAKPGIAFDTATWPYVAFKGGSAPGVLAGSWYAEHADGSAVVVAFQLASTGEPIDQRLAFAVAGDAFRLFSLAEAAWGSR